mgnify:CR=1 FL=1
MNWYISILVVILFVLCSGYTFGSWDQLIVNFCSAQKDMKCWSTFATDIPPIEKKFITFKHWLKDKPTALIAAQLQRVIQLTQQTETTPVEELKTRYLRRRLQQRQTEIREKMETISLSPTLIRSLRSTYVNDAQFLHAIRQYIIPRLVATWFTKFSSKPYGQSTGLYVDTDGQFYVDPITLRDDLDAYLASRWKTNKQTDAKNISLYFTPKEIDKLWFVYLFKNKEDLEKLWYTLVSNRERINTDVEYRRFNIKTAFDQIGPVRILMPGESLSFLEASNFDMDVQQLYKWGKVIASDEEVDDYWGGLCGAATAIYQWTVTNSGLGIKMRNHSKRYKNLYTATIDGKRQDLPWVDATIYSPSLDLVLTNTKSYPIILSMNYDGTYKWLESVFTLWKAGDTGSLEYVGKRNYTATLNVKWGWTRAVTWQCHSWLINGKKQERCYKEIK